MTTSRTQSGRSGEATQQPRRAHEVRSRLAAAVRRAVRYRGMLVLVLWQMPLQPVVRPNGSLGLMIGAGTDENALLSCSGDLISSEPVGYQVAALQGDYNLTSTVRVDGVAGMMRSDHDSHDGAFGGVQLRDDWPKFGIGAGIASAPWSGELDGRPDMAPTFYLRGGSAEGLHLRLDVLPLTPFGAQQLGRVGFGYNAVLRDRTSFVVSVAGLGDGETVAGVAGELTVPLADRLALRFEGHYAPGHEHPVSGVAVGGRLLLGAGPRGRTSFAP